MGRTRLAFASLLAVTSLAACADDGDTPTQSVATAAGGTSAGSGGQAQGTSGSGGTAGKGASGQGGHDTAGAGGSTPAGGMTNHGGAAGVGGGQHGGMNAGGASGGTAGAAGTSGLGGNGGSGDSLLGVCATFWGSVCQQLSTCDAVSFAAKFADVSACAAAHAKQCDETTLGPGSNATVADVAACFAGYGALDCPASLRLVYEHSALPAACNYAPGKLALGASCVADSECTARLCRTNALGGCGVCATETSPPAACVSSADCPHNFVCALDLSAPAGSPNVCKPYVEKGAPCDVVPCHAELACVGGTCVDRLPQGALCDPLEFGCALTLGCNAVSNHCEPLVVAAAGEPCGVTESGAQAACALGSECRFIFQVGAGTCVATKSTGEACELDQECSSLDACDLGVCHPATASSCEGHAGMGGSGGSAGSGGFDHGAPSTVYPAPHPPLPHALKGAGSVMKHPVIIPIFYSSDTSKPPIVDFLTKLLAGTYFSVTTAEYGIAQPTLAPTITIADPAPLKIIDPEVRAFLRGKLDGTHPEYTPGGGEPIYVFYLPYGTTIDFYPTGFESCTWFGGYHDVMELADGTSVSYAILPQCDPNLGFVLPATTHELVETVTDPNPGMSAYYGMEDSHVLWGIDGGEELGDLCEYFPGVFGTDPSSGQMVQSTWSNASAAASHSPCVPWVGPYFAAAPVMDDDLALPSIGVVTKGIKIPVGGTRTIEVDLFSDQSTGGDFSVDVYDYDVSQGKAPRLNLTLDKSSGQNGEKLALTITVLSIDPTLSVDRFYLHSTLGGQQTVWLGVVGE